MQAEDSSSLIALLEWELTAAQAREAELRRRVARLLSGRRGDFHTFRPRAGDMHRLWEFMREDQDDTRLRQRLESARWEARHASSVEVHR